MTYREKLEKISSSVLGLGNYDVSFFDEADFRKFITGLLADRRNDFIEYKGIRTVNNIDFTGYVSEGIKDLFISYVKLRCRIRLITRPLNLSNRQDRKNLKSMKEMSDSGVEIKINDRVHARMFHSYNNSRRDTLILGSFDLNKEGILGERNDAGIRTRNPILLGKAHDFFERVWTHPENSTTFEEYYEKNKKHL